MTTIKSLLVAGFCCYFVVACSGEDKKEPASGEASAKGGVDTDNDTEKTPIGDTEKSSGSAKKNPLGGLGVLMGGKKTASGAKNKGLLGVGGMLGGMGAAPAGAAGAPAVAKADEGKMGKVESSRDVDKKPPSAPPVVAGADCQAVAAHLGKIIEKEMKSGQLEGIDVAPEMLAQMAPMIAMACQQQQWSPAARACILKATDAATMESCESLIEGMAGGTEVDLGEDDIRLDDLGDISSDPVPSGDAECDKLAVYLVDAMIKEVPPDQAQAMGQMKVMIQNEIAKECAKTPWPKAMRSCLLGASTEAAMEKCAAAAGMAD